MKTNRTIRIALAAFVAAAIAIPAAFGAGEPKNQKPFTRTVGGTVATTRVVRLASGANSPLVAGEPKNEYPFTAPALADPGLARAMREAASPSLGLGGAAKSGQPSTSPVVAGAASSFDWTDAGIGVLAGAGICLLLGGTYLLVSGSRYPRPAGIQS